MTDKEYITAFLNNDQIAFSRFYRDNRTAFIKTLGTKFGIFDDTALTEILSDACLVLWKNIQNGKLTEDNLTTTLSGYLFGIGRLLTHEFLRKKDSHIDFDSLENVLSDGNNDFEDEKDEDKMWIAAMRAVSKWKDSCEKLLKKFYIEKLSWKEIAEQLDYKNADSAKTQKNKCMSKIKVEAENQLKQME